MLARGFLEGIQRWELVEASQIFRLKYGKALVETNRKLGAVPVYGTNGRCGWNNSPLFKGPGVILGRKGQGPLGVEWCPEDYWVIDTGYTLELLTDAVELKYAYYLIKFVGLNHLKDGTSNPTLSRDSFGSQHFPIPPLNVQLEVVEILEGFDKKIALLRETNATLEAIAQALFKSWFVDFDPVRAKAEGRDPEGVPPELADLFPSEFEDAELGSIPKGWKVGKVSTTSTLSKQARNPLNDPELEFEHYSLPAFDLGQLPTMELGESIKSNKFVVHKDSVLLSKLNPHIPRLWLPSVNNPLTAVSSTEFLVLRPINGFPREWVYLLLGSERVQSSLRQLVTGTSNSHQRVKPNNLMDIAVVIPPKGLIHAFFEVIAPLLQRASEGRAQSAVLAQLRDTLLPRLMSGKLRTQGEGI